jgi:septum formation protein
VEFRVEAPEVEELTQGDARRLVAENALRKARAVQGRRVLGVDTAVVLDGRSFGKPRDEEEAETFLRRLSGRGHEVWSGIALRERGDERTATAMTRVHFRLLEQHELDWYLASGEWRDRAGAYAIQGRGSALVEAVEGDFWNVVGLPVAELRRVAPLLVTS